jgi:hypothetical protein
MGESSQLRNLFGGGGVVTAVIGLMAAMKEAHKYSYRGMDLKRRPQRSIDLN